MFTGIIEDVGSVEFLGISVLRLRTCLKEIRTGESVAVNGICLTVAEATEVPDGMLIGFEYSPETRARTNIPFLRSGSRVNLERALRMSDRLGGHFVTGHVEETGELIEKVRHEHAWTFRFGVSDQGSRYVVPKGSIAVDGISLTVVERMVRSFTVAVVPYTYENTNFHSRKPGEKVNLEPDILAKYTECLLAGKGQKSTITKEFLKDHGFIN